MCRLFFTSKPIWFFPQYIRILGFQFDIACVLSMNYYCMPSPRCEGFYFETMEYINIDATFSQKYKVRF